MLKKLATLLHRLFGPKVDTTPTPPAPSRPRDGTIYRGDGKWCFVAEVSGHDLLLRSTIPGGLTATWFGGANDSLDSGETASGVSTKANPQLIACSLPMDLHRSKGNPCDGSPLPLLPWGLSRNLKPLNPGTVVLVTALDHKGNQKTISCPLIDIGPARSAQDPLDLTVAAFQQFFPRHVQKGVMNVQEIRILDGARWMVGI